MKPQKSGEKGDLPHTPALSLRLPDSVLSFEPLHSLPLMAIPVFRPQNLVMESDWEPNQVRTAGPGSLGVRREKRSKSWGALGTRRTEA